MASSAPSCQGSDSEPCPDESGDDMTLGARNRVAGTVKRVHGASNGCTPALTGGNAQAAGRCTNRLHTHGF
jgi:hypothetical protein